MRTANLKIAGIITFAVIAISTLNVVVVGQEEETRKTGAITGRVVNQNGQPISNAQVFVTAQRSLPQPRITSTDAGGNFQVGELDALVYFVNASAPSYINVPREPDTPPSYYRIGDSLTITMLKGGVITGTVTALNGDPMVQVGVRAQMIKNADGKPPVSQRFPVERRTDDRGIYRIYGLPPGSYLVSAGGRGSFGFNPGAYDTDAPTYSPSSTRDTAAEVVVRSGEESTGIDIRYRGEPGHAISGTLTQPSESAANITLNQIVNGRPQISAYTFQPPNRKGFAFYGVTDGEYDLVAQTNAVAGEWSISEPRRIIVKGSDVTGIELVAKPLAAMSGKVNLEETTAPECATKRRPVLTETLLIARRIQSEGNNPVLPNFSFAQSAVDGSGDFQLRGLPPGQFSLNTRFFAKYWYVRSIKRESSQQAANLQTDLARTGVTLKFGDRISGLKVTLAGGAASLRGVLNAGDGETVPPGLFLNLVPSEKEAAEDVLRFFTAPVNADGTFSFGNLPPGRYWVVPNVPADTEPRSDEKLREPASAGLRTRLRIAAEAAKASVELRPCQNSVDYQLSLKTFSLKN